MNLENEIASRYGPAMHDTIDSFEKAATTMKELVTDVVQAAYILGESNRGNCGFFYPLEYECDDEAETIVVQVSQRLHWEVGRGRTMVSVSPPLTPSGGFDAFKLRVEQFFTHMGRRLLGLDVVYLPHSHDWGLLVSIAL